MSQSNRNSLPVPYSQRVIGAQKPQVPVLQNLHSLPNLPQPMVKPIHQRPSNLERMPKLSYQHAKRAWEIYNAKKNNRK